MTQRVFAALRPSQEALDHLEAFLEPRRDHADLRWVSIDDVHLTLAFYGAIDDRIVDELVVGLAESVPRRRAGRVRVAGGGAFPHADRGKVLWAGLEAPGWDDELAALSAGCRSAGARVGAPVDGSRFRPHLTLARPRPTQLTSWVRLLDDYAGPWWSADEVVLMTSEVGVTRGRPHYGEWSSVALGPAADDHA